MNVYREYHIVRTEQRKLKDEGYAAISYTDHYEDGVMVEGAEDFTLERWKGSVVSRTVYIPTGEVNRGGKRTWEFYGRVFSRDAKSCGKIAKIVMGGREYSLRQY